MYACAGDVSNAKQMKTTLMLLSLFVSMPAIGDKLSPAMKEEVLHLFSFLEKSGCEFYRNGSWHQGSEASVHLRKKYQYLLGNRLLSSTESFIDRAATESSISGKPYQVRCGNSVTFESAPWFKAELVRYRKRGTLAP